MNKSVHPKTIKCVHAYIDIYTHYNKELFIRNSKGVKLTKKGEELYHQYKKIILLWEQTESQMKNHDKSLRIGTMVSFGGKQISAALNDLSKAHPDLNVTLKTGSTEEIDQLLTEGQIDIGITIGSFNNKHIKYEKSGTEEMVIIGGNISQETTFNKYLLQKNVLILSEKCLYHSILRNIYDTLNIKSGDFIEIGDPETLIQFASMGMGITLIPKRIASYYNIDSYLEVPKPFKYMDSYYTRRLNYELSPIEKQFFELNNKFIFSL
ncbi:LysR family transcriptional regulator [Paraliobacillus ryukyuensis]|uniref:LysR family transcriptional regulator n=1 Tax=Paraliobacillus ryukyuensis TaxID=200904 RepID=UPI0009A8EFFB|nr:LysR family transcriptional regulator [Paraliobacillus ryukyuensis]